MRKVVMFDFDGVLLDSFEACYIVFYHQFEATRDQYRVMYEGNIFESLENAHFPEKVVPSDIDLRKVSFDAKSLLPVHEGMKEALATLSEKFQLFIVTSSTEVNVNKWLQMKGLDNYFKEVLGRETAIKKADKIKYVIEKYNVTNEECIFVTDTVGDIKEATQSNISAIGVGWGFHTVEQLQEHTDLIAATPQELENYLLS